LGSIVSNTVRYDDDRSDAAQRICSLQPAGRAANQAHAGALSRPAITSSSCPACTSTTCVDHTWVR
jgi:hypothetical protein